MREGEGEGGGRRAEGDGGVAVCGVVLPNSLSVSTSEQLLRVCMICTEGLVGIGENRTNRDRISQSA